MFYTDWKPTILEGVNQYKGCLFHQYARRHVHNYQNQDNYSSFQRDLNHLAFGETAIEHFHFWNNETEDISIYQSNPVGVELFFYANTFVGFMLYILHPAF